MPDLNFHKTQSPDKNKNNNNNLKPAKSYLEEGFPAYASCKSDSKITLNLELLSSLLCYIPICLQDQEINFLLTNVLLGSPIHYNDFQRGPRT